MIIPGIISGKGGKAFPSLPLAAGARLLAYGDSYVERGGGTYTPSGALLGGKSILGASLWGVLGVDPRFNTDAFWNPAKPYGLLKIDGVEQGLSGISVTDPSNPARAAYACARNPQIAFFDIGKNDCNVGAALGSIQSAILAMLDQFTAIGCWQVFCTQAAFRQGAGPGDWSPTGAAQLECTALNNWILGTLSSRRGVAGIVDLTGINGNQSVGNNLFTPDKLHQTYYSVITQLYPPAATVLNTLVSPAAALNPIDPSNKFPPKALLGTTGSMTNAAVDPGVATNLQGVTFGLRVLGTVADAAVTLCSKETTFPFTTCTLTQASPGVVNLAAHGFSINDAVVFYSTGTLPTGLTAGRTVFVSPTNFTANSFQVINTSGSSGGINFTGSPSGTVTVHGGYDAQVVTVTPVNNGTKIHSIVFSDTLAISYSSLGLIAGDWVAVKFQVTTDSSPIWVPDTDNDGFHQPGQMRIVQSDAGSDQIWIEDNWCGIPGQTNVLRVLFQIVQTGSDQFQGGFNCTVEYRSDLGGTGVVKWQVMSIEKLSSSAVPNPSTAWGLSLVSP